MCIDLKGFIELQTPGTRVKSDQKAVHGEPIEEKECHWRREKEVYTSFFGRRLHG